MNKPSAKFVQVFRDIMYSDILISESREMTDDFWNSLYVQRKNERQKFKRFAMSHSTHLARVSGPIGSGKSTFTLEKFINPNYEPLGQLVYVNCMSDEVHVVLEQSDRWQTDFRKIINDSVYKAIRNHMYYSADGGVVDADTGPHEVHPRIRRSVDARIAAGLLLASNRAADTSYATKLLSKVEFGSDVSWRAQRDELASIILDRDEASEDDLISPILRCRVTTQWLTSYALSSEHLKVFLFVDNADSLPFRSVHQGLLPFLKQFVKTGEATTAALPRNRNKVPKTKCIIALRDENIGPFREYGSRTTRMASIELGTSPPVKLPGCVRLPLQTTGDWIAMVLSKRIELFESEALRHSQNWKSLAEQCGKIVKGVWIPVFASEVTGSSSSRLRGSLLRASNLSVRLVLELIVMSTLDWLETFDGNEQKTESLLECNDLVHRGRTIRTLTTSTTEYTSFLLKWREECESTIKSQRPCSTIRATLAYLQCHSNKKKRVSVHELIQSNHRMLGISPDQTRDALFTLYLGPNDRPAEFVVIFQQRWISEPDDIEDSGQISITPRGSELVSSFMHAIDLWGWLAFGEGKGHLYEMSPTAAAKYVHRIASYVVEVARYHWYSWCQNLVPRLKLTASDKPFVKYMLDYNSGKNCFFMERTANVHAHLLEIYMDQAFRGPKAPGLLVDGPGSHWPSLCPLDRSTIRTKGERSQLVRRSFEKNKSLGDALTEINACLNTYRVIEKVFRKSKHLNQQEISDIYEKHLNQIVLLRD